MLKKPEKKKVKRSKDDVHWHITKEVRIEFRSLAIGEDLTINEMLAKLIKSYKENKKND